MLKGVRTAALRCDRGGAGLRSANWLDGTGSCLERKQTIWSRKTPQMLNFKVNENLKKKRELMAKMSLSINYVNF